MQPTPSLMQPQQGVPVQQGISGGFALPAPPLMGMPPGAVAPVMMCAPNDQQLVDTVTELESFIVGPSPYTWTVRPVRPGCCDASELKFEVADHIFGPALSAGRVTSGCCGYESMDITVPPVGVVQGTFSVTGCFVHTLVLRLTTGETIEYTPRQPGFCQPDFIGYIGRDARGIRYRAGVAPTRIPCLCCGACGCSNPVSCCAGEMRLKSHDLLVTSELKSLVYQKHGLTMSGEVPGQERPFNGTIDQRLHYVPLCCGLGGFRSVDSTDTTDVSMVSSVDIRYRGTDAVVPDPADQRITLGIGVMEAFSFWRHSCVPLAGIFASLHHVMHFGWLSPADRPIMGYTYPMSETLIVRVVRQVAHAITV